MLDHFWDAALISQIVIIAFALLAMCCIGLTSSYAFKNGIFFKIISMISGICAIANGAPLLLKLTSDICTIEKGICNPSQIFCVSSCFWAGGSLQTLAGSLMWLSTSITTALIPSAQTNTTNVDLIKNDCTDKDEESSYGTRSYNSKSVQAGSSGDTNSSDSQR